MGIVSIEEALLGFVRKVKSDPGVSDLFRDALHELEVVLDPAAAQQQPAETDTPAGEPPAHGDQSGGEQPAATDTPAGEPPAHGDQSGATQPVVETVPEGQEPMPPTPTPAEPTPGEQAPQGG